MKVTLNDCLQKEKQDWVPRLATEQEKTDTTQMSENRDTASPKMTQMAACTQPQRDGLLAGGERERAKCWIWE